MFKDGLFALLIAMIATASFAQAQPKKGPNGGMVVTSQEHPIEFVLEGQKLIFYISDHDGSSLSTKDMRGRATVQEGGKTATVPLEPAAPNMMIATCRRRSAQKRASCSRLICMGMLSPRDMLRNESTALNVRCGVNLVGLIRRRQSQHVRFAPCHRIHVDCELTLSH
jgi:hypothetical protein